MIDPINIIKRLGANPVFYQFDLKNKETEEIEERIKYGYKGPGWYFIDEAWQYQYGPYELREDANKACKEYAKNLQGG